MAEQPAKAGVTGPFGGGCAPLPHPGALEQGNASLCSLWPLMITSRDCPSACSAGCCLQAQALGPGSLWAAQGGMLSPCLRHGGRGGSLGLIPYTNSCTFPRARPSLLVTGLEGGCPPPLLGARSQQCCSLVSPPHFPVLPAPCTAQTGAAGAVWLLRWVPAEGEGVN